MTSLSKKDPAFFKISEYIRDNFREDLLIENVDILKEAEKKIYKVVLSHDDIIHHLKFGETGILLSRELEPAFPPDSHDDRGEISDFYEDNNR